MVKCPVESDPLVPLRFAIESARPVKPELNSDIEWRANHHPLPGFGRIRSPCFLCPAQTATEAEAP